MSAARFLWIVMLAPAFACGASGDAGPTNERFPETPYASIVSASGAYTVELRLAPEQPPSPGNADVQIAVRDASGAPVDGLAVSAKTWMPAMGHGSAGPRGVRALGGGRYAIDEVSLPMPGRWELRMTLQSNGAVNDGAVASVDVQ